ncbi:MAG TPA: glycosyltransferase [Hanamia sp.]|nr:glycosyltransferase [Hanamia sp.]
MKNIDEVIFLKEKKEIKDPVFSILIPSWNNLEYLKLCIESIQKNSSFSHQIIVHINEGLDGTLDWVKQQNEVAFTHSSENIGVCYALNYCSVLADADYIVYMNDDMYVCPQWDKFLLEEIQKTAHKNFFFSATAIEPRAQSKCSIEKNYGQSPVDFDEQKLLEEFDKLEMEDWSGATWPPNVVHKDIWELSGKYSIEFSPGMYSDPDFSMKLWQMGVRVFKGVAKSRVYHFGSVSVKKVKKNEGYYRFIAKWGMAQSTFSKNYLKRGEKYSGPLSEPELPLPVKLKSSFKQFVNLFKNKD